MRIFALVPALAYTLAISVTISGATALSAVTQPELHRVLQQQGTANVIVTMKSSPKNIRATHDQKNDLRARGDRINGLITDMESHAKLTQQPVKDVLAREMSKYKTSKSFWISNEVYIEGAEESLVEELLALDEVVKARVEQIIALPSPTQLVVLESNTTAMIDASVTANPEWGVERVKAGLVWAGGNTGEGIVVASIDTGVLATHEALKNNFRSSYGWYDPERHSKNPYDANGHGTHTMGTIAGSNGVGVAPGSTWMSCKGCRSAGCYESDLLACAEFTTCPTDTQGRKRDCAKAPRVVSNSWGGGQGNSFFQDAVDTWIAAGIIPVFSNGNSGPDCGTVNSPGDYANVIGVGATDINDLLASFSSKGPAVKANLLKPDISAPGVSVRSAYNSDTNAYALMSGTSMAAPHVSGVVALLLSAYPGLSFEEVKSVLTQTADISVQSVELTCNGDEIDGGFPNNKYGHGLANAFSAISSVVTPTPTETPTPSLSPVTMCTSLNKRQCDLDMTCSWNQGTRACV